MRILIIGGSVFLGRHLVLAALAAEHQITTFNRGSHLLEEQAGVERVFGDRERDLDLLCGRSWDAVIDTCGMEPQLVAQSAEKLRAQVGQYVFISSISAYHNFRQINMNEKAQARLLGLDAEQDYGSRKAYCEQAVADVYADKALLIRPGLIGGRYEQSDRFSYWPLRISRGGSILAPGRPKRQVQFIDVRDLSEWIIRLIEAGIAGLFNATGPGFTFTMKNLLDACLQYSPAGSELLWIPDQFLLDSDVAPWSQIPLWIPDSDEEHRGFTQIDCSKALNKGLSFRPVNETIEDLLIWERQEQFPVELKAGLAAAKEQDIIRRFLKKR